MNIALSDPFPLSTFPEFIEDTLEEGYVVCCSFNRRGTLLACGCNDGRLIVWDFVTRGVVRALLWHVQPITSVSWSRDGRFLLASSLDNRVSVWDICSADRVHSFDLDAPVLMCQFHPRNSSKFLACLLKRDALLLDVSTGEKFPLPGDASSDPGSVTASFDRRGERIYIGTARGQVLIVNSESRAVIETLNVANAPIKRIVFCRRTGWFLVNSNDRVIRVFDQQHECKHRHQDEVNKLQWKQCGFSRDGDYVIAGSAQGNEHKVYIWERLDGTLQKILLDAKVKEGILDLAWHPVRPMIASVSATYGVVYIWGVHYTENWSAYAPDFTELEENEEYVERESEFDEKSETGEATTGAVETDETDMVDIETLEPVAALADSDEETDEVVLPTMVDPDLDALPIGSRAAPPVALAVGGRAIVVAPAPDLPGPDLNETVDETLPRPPPLVETATELPNAPPPSALPTTAVEVPVTAATTEPSGAGDDEPQAKRPRLNEL